MIRTFCVLVLSFATNVALAASSNNGSFDFQFPVRASIFVGNQLSQNNLGLAVNQTVNHIAYGADLNIPIKPIYFTAGITGWLVPTDFFLVGPYVGFAGDYTDIFVGIAGAQFKNTKVDPSTSPVETTTKSAALSCGMLGLRKYFGNGVNFGAGLTGFWCKAEKYTQEVKTSTFGTPVTTEFKQESLAYGGLLYLMLFWNDTGRAQTN